MSLDGILKEKKLFSFVVEYASVATDEIWIVWVLDNSRVSIQISWFW